MGAHFQEDEWVLTFKKIGRAFNQTAPLSDAAQGLADSRSGPAAPSRTIRVEVTTSKTPRGWPPRFAVAKSSVPLYATVTWEAKVGAEFGPLIAGGPDRVVRRGKYVLRKTGPWTPTVHALLAHFERLGVRGAPRARGLTAGGCERVSFVEGTTIVWPEKWPSGMQSDEYLRDVAQLVRLLHDASETFRPPSDAIWQEQPLTLSHGDIICHNDLGPWNTVTRGNRPVAIIDWDMAAPGTRDWDVALALWHWVPLYDDNEILEWGWATVPDRRHRIEVFSAAYGIETPRDQLLKTIRKRQVATLRTIRWAQSNPNLPGADVWVDCVPPHVVRRQLRWLDSNAETLLP